MIERFTDEELEQILRELEDRKKLSKSRTKHEACAGQIADIKKWLSEQTEAKITNWGGVRSSLFCYCDLVTGNFSLERFSVDGVPFVCVARSKDILEDVDLEQYKETMQTAIEAFKENLQKHIDGTAKN